MLAKAVAAFFRYKVVGSIIIVACWPALDQKQLLKDLSNHGLRVSFACNLSALDVTTKHGLHGVLYFSDTSNILLKKTKTIHFATWYKWLIIAENLPKHLNDVRYDADIVFLKLNYKNYTGVNNVSDIKLHYLDVYIHPTEGLSVHPWAYWNNNQGLQLTQETQRILRRNDLKGYPLKIATPVGLFSPKHYTGSFLEYLTDESRGGESATKCGYATANLIANALNATAVLMQTLLWNSKTDNSSMLRMVSIGEADLSGSILRLTHERIILLDYITTIWPFSVGFTYIAERESPSNMYVEPFSDGVWWSFFGTGVLLAVALRVTARGTNEKDGAFYSAIASCLQQDTSTVPEGGSGRTVFMTLSICSMLVHAYYTSAVVSALMNSGRGGPETLRALADSRFSIAVEDYNYIRYMFFDVKSNWSDMEYLKEKKMTTNLFQPIEKGVEMLASGNTAYHTEYNNLYPLLNNLRDEQLCRLQYIDTIPQTVSFVVATKWSQFANVATSKGTWLHETGLADRTTRKWLNQPPPCRASLIAERVKFGDIAPLITVTILGAIASLMVLSLEIIIDKIKVKFSKTNTEPIRNFALYE